MALIGNLFRAGALLIVAAIILPFCYFVLKYAVLMVLFTVLVLCGN